MTFWAEFLTFRSPSLDEQFLGGGAGGGEDAEEVGAAGPGGDVEGECVNV